MRTRIVCSIVAAAALVMGMLFTTPTAAKALSPGVEFSADALSTWQTNTVVYALGHSHGKVIAGGSFTQIRPPIGGSGSARTQAGLAIFDAETGTPDSCQYTLALSGGNPSVRAIVTSADQNTVYIGGNFSSINGRSIYRAAALDIVACTVKPFKTNSISASVYGLALDENTLYLAGAFNSVAGQPRQKFAAVNATTGDLLPWVADADDTGRAVAVSPDGAKVAVGGDFFTINGHDSHSIAVVDGATGANLRDYPLGFISSTSVTKTLYSSGDAFYGGNEGTGGGVFDGRFAIDWNTLDQKWRDLCLGATQAVLEYKGTLYSANHSHDCSQNAGFQDGKRSYFVAEDAETATLLGWNPTANDGTGEGIGPRALVIATGTTTGKAILWAGGEFTRINGEAQQGLTRFGPDDVGAIPTPSATATATSDGSIQVRFRTVVDPDDSLLTYRVFRDGASTPIWEGQASSLWWKRPQVTVVDDSVQPGVRYAYRVTASDGTNTSLPSAIRSATATAAGDDYARTVRADEPRFLWSYEGATSTWVQDSSARTHKTDGLSGIAENGVGHSSEGAFSADGTGAGQFDGVDDYVWEDDYVPAPTTYSIETWIKTSTTSGGKIVGFGNGRPRTDSGDAAPSGNYDRQIYMTDTGRLVYGVWIGSAATITTSEQYNDNEWHHIVATQGASGMALYVDGLRVGMSSVSSAQDYYGVWHVGGDNLNGWPDQPSSRYFSGLIDETAIYEHVLGQKDVLEHYAAAGGSADVNPSPQDAYGAAVYDQDPLLYWRLGEESGSVAADSSLFGSYPGRYENSVTLGVTGVIGGDAAVQVHGNSSSTVAMSSSTAGGGAFSAELWFATETSVGGKLIGFENSQTGNGSSYDKHVYMNNDGKLVFGVYTGSTDVVISPQSYNDGDWHHVVASQSSTGMSLYVDGALVASSAVNSNQAFTGYWRIGGGSLGNWPELPSSSYFAGKIDEVAVYAGALDAADVASHYSIGVSDTTPPSTPSNVAATLDGSDVVLTWTASDDNVSVSSYRVYRGSTSDVAIDETTLVSDQTDTSWRDGDAPFGTSFYRVVALDAAGNASEPSAAVSATVEDTEGPTTPMDVVASGSPTGVAVTWSESDDNVGVDHYTVYRGASAEFVADSASEVGEVTGTSFSDDGLANGTYYYRVTATDAAGNASAPSAAVSAAVEPDPVTEVVGVDADAMVYGVQPDSNYGTNSQLSSRGGTSPIESFLQIALPAAPDGMVISGAMISVRTSTDPAAGSTDSHEVSIVDGSWTEGGITWNNRPTDVAAALGTLDAMTSTNTAYTATLDARVLAPLSGQTITLRVSSSGSDNVRLWSSEASQSGYRPTLTVSYTPGSVPEPQVDSTPPSAPSGLTATASGNTVELAWAAATDDIGVTGYRVYRSATSPVAVDSSTQVGETTTTSFTDGGLAAGTYHYVITASDAAGNTSPASIEAHADVAKQPVEVTNVPTQDAMVISAAPDSNYGTNNQLASRAGTSPQESFLSFAVPAAPAGTVLASVTLEVRTSTDSVAASANSHTCTLITDVWSQSSITWNNRPTSAGVSVATLTGFAATNTSYDFSLDASAFVSHLGQDVTLRISGTGDDNVRLWSADGPSGYRPALTLTFAPVD